MPAVNWNILTGYLAGKYPGQIGVMASPDARWMTPYPFLPYAIDNGVFSATVNNGKEWNPSIFLGMLSKSEQSGIDPLFIVVPDVMYDRDATLKRWDEWAPRLESYGYRLAIAVQDGMTPEDMPSEETVAFMGGSDQFKWNQTANFISSGFDTHLARVNHYKRLFWAHQLGCMSCDGSGWFRRGNDQQADEPRYQPLLNYLEWTENPKTTNNLFNEEVPEWNTLSK